MIRQIVVLAGGLATRLYPLTKSIPKSLIPVANEPFIAHQLRTFKKNGIEEAVICIGHLADQIIDFVGDGSRFDLSVVYSVENHKLDTGGALRYAASYLDDSFFIIYGDSYLTQAFQPVSDFFSRHDANGLMCVFENNNAIEPSRVLLHGMYIQQYQKDPPPRGARHMEYGLNILRRDVVARINKEVFPISDYFDMLTGTQQLLAYTVSERFYEIGSIRGIKETDALIRESQKRTT